MSQAASAAYEAYDDLTFRCHLSRVELSAQAATYYVNA